MARKNARSSTVDTGPRAIRTARRLLSGAGSAALLFYASQPAIGLDFVAHGFTNSGRLIVASFDEQLNSSLIGDELPVRFEVVRNASRVDIRLVAASLHLLGKLRWLDEPQVSELDDCKELPELMRALLPQPEARFAEISFTRAILHDPNGVTPLPYGILASPNVVIFPTPAQEFDCHALVEAVPNDTLGEVCQAIVDGRAPGEVCSRCPIMSVCDRIAEQVVCADVDRMGVTLMHIGRHELTTVYAQFSEPVDDLTQLSDQIELLGVRPAS